MAVQVEVDNLNLFRIGPAKIAPNRVLFAPNEQQVLFGQTDNHQRLGEIRDPFELGIGAVVQLATIHLDLLERATCFFDVVESC